jgi:hypothetical protein
MAKFVQLNTEDCTYLLDLIESMDSQTPYTQRQREYTIPKLKKILQDPRSSKLAYQDVDYLLDLLEDDELEETEQQREMTRVTLIDIQNLQQSRFEETQDIEQQREQRRAKRSGFSLNLQKHFARTTS